MIVHQRACPALGPQPGQVAIDIYMHARSYGLDNLSLILAELYCNKYNSYLSNCTCRSSSKNLVHNGHR